MYKILRPQNVDYLVHAVALDIGELGVDVPKYPVLKKIDPDQGSLCQIPELGLRLLQFALYEFALTDIYETLQKIVVAIYWDGNHGF